MKFARSSRPRIVQSSTVRAVHMHAHIGIQLGSPSSVSTPQHRCRAREVQRSKSFDLPSHSAHTRMQVCLTRLESRKPVLWCPPFAFPSTPLRDEAGRGDLEGAISDCDLRGSSLSDWAHREQAPSERADRALGVGQTSSAWTLSSSCSASPRPPSSGLAHSPPSIRRHPVSPSSVAAAAAAASESNLGAEGQHARAGTKHHRRMQRSADISRQSCGTLLQVAHRRPAVGVVGSRCRIWNLVRSMLPAEWSEA